MNYYISDLHFGHKNIIRFDNRPFSNTEEMEERIVENWNARITNQDTAYILGDFVWKSEPEWERIAKRLNGVKVLICGNHDLKEPSAKIKKLFSDWKPYKEITDAGRHVIMCHYPILCYNHSNNIAVWHLHGHTHTTNEQCYVEKWTQQLVDSHEYQFSNMGHVINVGCMMSYVNYTPRTIDELIAAWQIKYKKPQSML